MTVNHEINLIFGTMDNFSVICATGITSAIDILGYLFCFILTTILLKFSFGPSRHAIPSPLSDDQKQALVDTHNGYRRNAGASNMLMLYWDDKLADMAQTKANLCSNDHDLSLNRRIPEYPWNIGQNLVSTQATLTTPAKDYDDMYSAEQPSFIYGASHSAEHYSQAMLATMTRMGCGTTVCLYPDRQEKHTTCHYEIIQN